MNPQLEPQQAIGESVLCLIEPALSELQCVDETLSGAHGEGQECMWQLRQREAPVLSTERRRNLSTYPTTWWDVTDLPQDRIQLEVIPSMDQKLHLSPKML